MTASICPFVLACYEYQHTRPDGRERGSQARNRLVHAIPVSNPLRRRGPTLPFCCRPCRLTRGAAGQEAPSRTSPARAEHLTGFYAVVSWRRVKCAAQRPCFIILVFIIGCRFLLPSQNGSSTGSSNNLECLLRTPYPNLCP